MLGITVSTNMVPVLGPIMVDSMEPIKSSSAAAEEWICDALALALADESPQALHRRLYLRLREEIELGRFAPGTRLPSSRRLAAALGVGRNTVISALDQLLHEGFIRSRRGAGSYVSRLEHPLPRAVVAAPAPEDRGDAGLSSRGAALLALSSGVRDGGTTFVPGLPALDLFPWSSWRAIQARQLKRPPREWLGYQTQGGLPRLREVLCDYLRLSRSVRCTPEQIVITQGAQQAFMLIAQLLAEPGDLVWFEEPGYLGARAALLAAGLRLSPTPVDADGLDPARGAGRPKLVYVTPSYQYPCGVTLSLERRLGLLAEAERSRAWVIEDDYDSEFRYGSKPLASLQGLGDGRRVLYVGTFSKVMYPGLGLGYLVLPPALIETFRTVSFRLARESHYPLQAALAEFIDTGAFTRHIRRCRDAYRERQAALRSALAPAIERGLELSSGEAGMHLLATHPKGIDEEELQRRGAREDVVLRGLSPLHLSAHRRSGLVLGYAAATVEQIERAGALLDGWLAQSGR